MKKNEDREALEIICRVVYCSQRAKAFQKLSKYFGQQWVLMNATKCQTNFITIYGYLLAIVEDNQDDQRMCVSWFNAL